MFHQLRKNRSLAESDQLTFGSDRRRSHRYEVIWSGVIYLPDGTHVECAILDLSAAGAKVILGEPLSQDQQVFFVSPRFETVTACVAWIDGSKAGLHFRDGIDRVLRVLSGKDGNILLANDMLSLLGETAPQ